MSIWDKPNIPYAYIVYKKLTLANWEPEVDCLCDTFELAEERVTYLKETRPKWTVWHEAYKMYKKEDKENAL